MHGLLGLDTIRLPTMAAAVIVPLNKAQSICDKGFMKSLASISHCKEFCTKTMPGTLLSL